MRAVRWLVRVLKRDAEGGAPAAARVVAVQAHPAGGAGVPTPFVIPYARRGRIGRRLIAWLTLQLGLLTWRAGGRWLISMCCAALLGVTWLAWADPFGGFGRDAYVAWRLEQGDSLFPNLARGNGPLSPLVNSTVFRVAGVSLLALQVFNLAILAAALVLLRGLVRQIADERAAAVAVTAVVLALTLAPPEAGGSWAAPAMHELTHGTTLMLVALACFLQTTRTRGIGWLAAGGFCVGLCYLTTTAFVVAAPIASAVWLGLTLYAWRVRWWQATWRVAAFAAAAAAPVAVGAWWLAGTGTAPGDLAARFAREQLANVDRLYRGLTAAQGWTIVLLGAVVATAVALTYAALRVAPRPKHRAAWAALVMLAVIALSLFVGGRWLARALIERPFVPCAAVLGAVSVAAWRRGRIALDRHTIARLSAVTLATLLAASLSLSPDAGESAFALAVIPLAVLVAAGVAWLPGWVDRRGGAGWFVRSAAAGGLIAVTLVQAVDTVAAARNRTAWVLRHTDDRLRLPPGQAREVAQLLGRIEQNVFQSRTVVVAPRGAMINYLSRRPNGLGVDELDADAIARVGEPALLAALAENPPALVLFATAGRDRWRGADAPALSRAIETFYTPDPAATLKPGRWEAWWLRETR
jgi:hypothetical protein